MSRSIDAVVVNYHSGTELVDALSMIDRFLGPEASMLMVDNSPGDGTAEAVKSAIPSVTVISNERNLGFAAAVNQALHRSSAPIVLLVNPDVTEVRGDVGDLLDLFDRDPRVGAVGVELLNEDGSRQVNVRSRLSLMDIVFELTTFRSRFPDNARMQRSFYPGWAGDTEREVDIVFGAFLALRREALDDIGLLDERFFVYFEETDWLVRAKDAGWKTVYTPKIRAIHRGRSSTNEGPATLELLLLESGYAYIRKHFGAGRGLLVRGAFILFDGTRLVVARLRSHAAAETLRATLRDRLRVHLTARATFLGPR
jgi:hypothetical protein